jgi:hypothetical protein
VDRHGVLKRLHRCPASAAEQARGGGWIVGGQDDQVRHLLLEREDFAGGLGEQAPVAHALPRRVTRRLAAVGSRRARFAWRAVAARSSGYLNATVPGRGGTFVPRYRCERFHPKVHHRVTPPAREGP